MKKLFLKIILSLFAVTTTNALNAQKAQSTGGDHIKNEWPKIGQPCPDFLFKKVRYYSDKELSNKNLKGKYTILDFFSADCTACFASFPHTNEMMKKFGDKLQIILVGYDQKNADVETRYETYRKKFDLKMPVAYDSVYVNNSLVSHGFPTLLWIDPNGIVKAITNTGDFREEKINEFISGKSFKFTDWSNAAKENSKFLTSPFSYPSSKGKRVYFTDEDSTHLFISESGRWNKKLYGSNYGRWFVNTGSNAGKSIEIVLQLKSLYLFAYLGADKIDVPNLGGDENKKLYGLYYRKPILEVKDNSLLEARLGADGTFWYRQIDKNARSKEVLLRNMQEDLKRTFSYVGTIETRVLPYYKLIITDQEKAKRLRKIQKDSVFKISYASMEINKYSWGTVFGHLQSLLREDDETYLDDTGLTGNVSIKLTAAMQDREDVRRVLQNYGLDIIQAKKEFKVLVIKDAAKDTVEQ